MKVIRTQINQIGLERKSRRAAKSGIDEVKINIFDYFN